MFVDQLYIITFILETQDLQLTMMLSEDILSTKVMK